MIMSLTWERTECRVSCLFSPCLMSATVVKWCTEEAYYLSCVMESLSEKEREYIYIPDVGRITSIICVYAIYIMQ